MRYASEAVDAAIAVSPAPANPANPFPLPQLITRDSTYPVKNAAAGLARFVEAPVKTNSFPWDLPGYLRRSHAGSTDPNVDR